MNDQIRAIIEEDSDNIEAVVTAMEMAKTSDHTFWSAYKWIKTWQDVTEKRCECGA